MSEDKMPTEVTATALGRKSLLSLAVSALVGGEAVALDQGVPWWVVPAAGVLVVVLWWAVFVVLRFLAARASTDGVKDWRDVLYPQLLRDWQRSKHSQVKPDEGEEKEQ